MKLRRFLSLFILVIVISLLSTSSALSGVVLSNFAEPIYINGGVTIGGGLSANPRVVFEVPSGGSTYELNAVTVFAGCFSPCPMDIEVNVYEDNSGSLGTYIGSLGTATLPNHYTDDGFLLYTFTATTPITLAPGMSYAVAFEAVALPGSSVLAYVDTLVAPTGIFTYLGSYAIDGIKWPDTHIAVEMDATPLSVSGGINVPHVGMIQIDQSQTQPAYDSPAGNIVQTVDGTDIYLPADYDNSFADTYVVTDTQVVDGRVWVSIFLGSENFVWVPLDQVTPLTYLE